MINKLFLCLIFFVYSGSCFAYELKTVESIEEKQWLRHLLPLPHEISIKEKVNMNPKNVSIRLRKGAGDIERNAANELKKIFKEKTGTDTIGGEFEIIIGTFDDNGNLDNIKISGSDKLKDLPNNDQAYIIQPLEKNKLLLTGFNEKGVWYATRTLFQLLEWKLIKDSVTIPLVSVLDWPDFAERGLWNMPVEWLPWLASIKMNYWQTPAGAVVEIKRDVPIEVMIQKRDLIPEAQLQGFRCLPYFYHLNFLNTHGLLHVFKAYPELAGVGDGALAGRYFAHKQGDQNRVPCASNPLLVKFIKDLMSGIASQGFNEMICWLSERPAQCECKNCTEIGQFVLEARACVEAWRQVRKTYPDFLIRLALSTTTTGRNYRILAETPPEIKIMRACATGLERVSNIPRDLFKNPLLDNYASLGRWIGSFDVPITANGNVETPEFKVPESSAHRIKYYLGQLLSRNYKCATGMKAWHRMGKEICGFNINAHAEWSWNYNGRNEREFAIVWATRQGYENPEAVGDWSDLMGPLEFDVYDSDFPTCYSWGISFSMVKERKRPYLGEGIFRYYRDPQDFDKKIIVCNKALQIADKFNDKYLASETKVVLSYIELAKNIYEIAELVATDDIRTVESQERLQKSIQSLKISGERNLLSIKEWRSALGPEPWHERVYDALNGTQTTVDNISEWLTNRYIY